MNLQESEKGIEDNLLNSLWNGSIYTTFPLDLKSSNQTFLRYSKKVEKYLIFQLKRWIEEVHPFKDKYNIKLKYSYLLGSLLKEIKFYKGKEFKKYMSDNGISLRYPRIVHYIRFTNLLLEYPRLQLCNIKSKDERYSKKIRSICESNKEFWKNIN